MIVVRYNTIQASTVAEIDRLVNQLLELGEGWEPVGGVQRIDQPEDADLVFLQTMIKREIVRVSIAPLHPFQTREH